MKIYATYNIKGGVGKTSTAVNLAYLAARDGYRVLLWDLDPQGAATFLFRVRPRVKGGGKALIRGTRSLDGAIKGTDFDHLDLLPADFTYRNLDLLLDAARKPARKLGRLLAPLRAEYDVVFLDCPPSISLLSESVLHAADILLVPLIPTTLSVRTLDQLTEFIADFDGQRPDILAFFSMIDRRKSMHKEIAATLPGQRSDVAATAIPALSLIEQMSVRRAPVTAFAPRSAAARSYAELWAEARERSGLRPVKGSVRAPVKTPASAPAKTPAGAAAKTPARAPAKTPARAPVSPGRAGSRSSPR
jgi:chromosome partitioning protein